jgi:type IV fimbrial biogenesis protein FimT
MLIRRANSAAGFTMIELMVTLSIFAILTAVAIPTMRTWVANNKVRAAADALQNGLRLAQAEAMRRSRQVVFSLTNVTPPATVPPVGAVVDGTSWVIWTVPSMTDGSEVAEFVQSGIMSSLSAGVTVTSSPAMAAACFNAMGRLTLNTSAGLSGITGGQTCVPPAVGTPPVQKFTIQAPGADRTLQVTLGVGGTVHLCDPTVAISDSHPEGC